MQTETLSSVHDFISGGGEMGELIRNTDWSRTPVGRVEDWPQSLRTAVSIMLNTHFPMYVAWGPEFTQFYNDGYRPILGATKHPAAMGSSTRITFREIWDIIGPMFEGVMEGRAVGVTDFLLPLDRYGFTEECYFIFSYSPIKQENGKPGGVLVTVTETTNRVLSERRLKTLHELGNRSSKCKTLSGAADNIIAVLDEARHDIPFAMLYLYDEVSGGYRRFGASGLQDAETVFPSSGDIARLHDCHQQAVELSKVFPAIAFDDGLPWPELPTKCYVSVLSRQDDRHPFGLLVLGVSGRLQFNDDYRKFFKLFSDQCVAVLSNANAFEVERKRVEALAEIDKAKTVFFSNISHEFRTPLTLMLGPLEDIMKDETSSARTREMIPLVHRNGLRLQKLVNNLLEFSRLEAGRIQAFYEPVDLSKQTAELASSFRSAVEKAGLQLIIDCPSVSSPAFVDPDMWERIILNLLSNAFKHTFEGNICVSVLQFEEWFEVQVKDTGVGIPEDQLPNLFERFHRVPNARSRTHEGSGIGLALVSELVKLHGGSIHVQSRVNHGTTFAVRLPSGNAHLPQDRIRNSPTQRPHSDRRFYVEEVLRWLPENGGGHHHHADRGWQSEAPPVNGEARPMVLLADDNADMREYVKRVLSPYCDVRDVSNGQAALRMAKETTPDLILTDVMMPELDGLQLVKVLRSDPVLKTVPIVLLSARAGEESKVEGLRDGADDYLVKPFSSRELVARVQANLRLARTRKESIRKLEGLIAERTRELKDVNRALKRSNDDLQQFAHVASHDLKEPVRKIKTFANRLKDEAGLALGEKAGEYLDKVLSSARRMSAMIDGILAYSTVSATPAAIEYVDLNETLHEIRNDLEVMIDQKNAEIECGPLPVLPGSRFLYYQLFYNLINNSLKFSKPGVRPRVQLTADTFLTEGKPFVRIVVSDNGIGFESAHADRIFDTFTRLHSKDKFEGTGLGLSLCRNIVLRHGGTIAAQGQPNAGASFIICLPR